MVITPVMAICIYLNRHMDGCQYFIDEERNRMKKGLLWIDKNTSELISLAQAIWEYAEVGLKEQFSSEVLINFLKKEGFDIETGVGGLPTAFTASFGEGRPVIGLLGEYDALPGLSQKAVPYPEVKESTNNGHGCGHNLLGVGSLGAAVALKEEIKTGHLQGTIRYYGCPAEEKQPWEKCLWLEMGLLMTWTLP